MIMAVALIVFLILFDFIIYEFFSVATMVFDFAEFLFCIILCNFPFIGFFTKLFANDDTIWINNCGSI